MTISLPSTLRPRLLLVDDHSSVRLGMRVALQHQYRGIQISEAGSRREALVAMRSFRPRFVFLDVNLPGGNGLDLLRQIRSSSRSAIVLMVAAEVDPGQCGKR